MLSQETTTLDRVLAIEASYERIAPIVLAGLAGTDPQETRGGICSVFGWQGSFLCCINYETYA